MNNAIYLSQIAIDQSLLKWKMNTGGKILMYNFQYLCGQPQTHKQPTSGIHVPFEAFVLHISFHIQKVRRTCFKQSGNSCKKSGLPCVIHQMVLVAFKAAICMAQQKCTFQISQCTYNILSFAHEARTISYSHLAAAVICHCVRK